MADTKVDVRNLSIRFQMSYEKKLTLREHFSHLYRKRGRQPAEMFEALSGVSTTVREGDVVGVIGPNGCGKSTLLRSISGIYHPDSGEVHCHGKVSALLALGTGFNNKLNGLENIRLNGLMVGMSPNEIDRALPMITEFADIGEHIHQPMKTYSNGMISRISFAIVLAMKPDILLIDEVFAVGDLEFQQKSERVLDQLLSEASCQMIITHNLDFVRERCNRAIYMSRGKVLADGEPGDVVNQYEQDVKSNARVVSQDRDGRRAA